MKLQIKLISILTLSLLFVSCGEPTAPVQQTHESMNANTLLDRESFTNQYFASNQNNPFLNPDDLTNNDTLINPTSDTRPYGD